MIQREKDDIQKRHSRFGKVLNRKMTPKWQLYANHNTCCCALFRSLCISISSGCYNTVPQPGWPKPQTFSSHSAEATSLKSRIQKVSFIRRQLWQHLETKSFPKLSIVPNPRFGDPLRLSLHGPWQNTSSTAVELHSNVIADNRPRDHLGFFPPFIET